MHRVILIPAFLVLGLAVAQAESTRGTHGDGSERRDGSGTIAGDFHDEAPAPAQSPRPVTPPEVPHSPVPDIPEYCNVCDIEPTPCHDCNVYSSDLPGFVNPGDVVEH